MTDPTPHPERPLDPRQNEQRLVHNQPAPWKSPPRPDRGWKLLIFDCDGVLVDSEPIGNRVFSEMVGELGLDLPSTTAERMFRGGQLSQCLEFIEQQRGQPVPHDFIPRFRERSASAFRNELRPIPGIHTALDQ
ncbi:MAG: HAD hydrolase-like protein, partial [Planctomycetaceae bacterium]